MPRTFTHRIVLIVPAAAAATANAAIKARGLSPDLKSLVSGLSPTGASPATHFWAAPMLTDAQYAALKTQLPGAVPTAQLFDWDDDADPDGAAVIAAGLGLMPVERGR